MVVLIRRIVFEKLLTFSDPGIRWRSRELGHVLEERASQNRKYRTDLLHRTASSKRTKIEA